MLHHRDWRTADNVVFGGVIGLGIDAASGAIKKYQPGVEIAMSLTHNCGGPRKGHGMPIGQRPGSPATAAEPTPYIELPIPKMLG
jgi:hypothetical protein